MRTCAQVRLWASAYYGGGGGGALTAEARVVLSAWAARVYALLVGSSIACVMLSLWYTFLIIRRLNEWTAGMLQVQPLPCHPCPAPSLAIMLNGRSAGII